MTPGEGSGLDLVSEVIGSLRSAESNSDLISLVSAIARYMGFRYFALIHHADLRASSAGCVNLTCYPAAIEERLFTNRAYIRDPVMRGCIFADSAFVWSELPRLIKMDKADNRVLEIGAREGLNEGITVPYSRLGDRLGSCTFAGTSSPDRVPRFVGIAQMIGIFAFQAARRLLPGENSTPAARPRLHPRPRDCVVLAGRGYSNKQIARALTLTPRTVDGYLTEARRLFGAHDRTELVVSAVLAGEVGLHELKRQPE
jgi:DNA-binding CsgD family transcriptional regulator